MGRLPRIALRGHGFPALGLGSARERAGVRGRGDVAGDRFANVNQISYIPGSSHPSQRLSSKGTVMHNIPENKRITSTSGVGTAALRAAGTPYAHPGAVLDFVQGWRAGGTDRGAESAAEAVERRFGVAVDPRSIDRALARRTRSTRQREGLRCTDPSLGYPRPRSPVFGERARRPLSSALSPGITEEEVEDVIHFIRRSGEE